MLHMNTDSNSPSPDAQSASKTLWTIREMAADFDITPRTLRFYEDKGLIAPRRDNGGRFYSEDDRARLEYILRAKRLGFSLNDIHAVQEVVDGRITDRNELALRKESMFKVLTELKTRRNDLDIISRSLGTLVSGIQAYLDDPAQNDSFPHAQAYEAALQRHMDDAEIFNEIPAS